MNRLEKINRKRGTYEASLLTGRLRDQSEKATEEPCIWNELIVPTLKTKLKALYDINIFSLFFFVKKETLNSSNLLLECCNDNFLNEPDKCKFWN